MLIVGVGEGDFGIDGIDVDEEETDGDLVGVLDGVIDGDIIAVIDGDGIDVIDGDIIAVIDGDIIAVIDSDIVGEVDGLASIVDCITPPSIDIHAHEPLPLHLRTPQRGVRPR